VLVVGTSKAGKTSLIKQLLGVNVVHVSQSKDFETADVELFIGTFDGIKVMFIETKGLHET